MKSIREIIETEINNLGMTWDIKGLIDSNKNVYTLGVDTKLISTVWELISKPLIKKIADSLDATIVEAKNQTTYPDFTLLTPDDFKIAIDVKSTYRQSDSKVSGFTLGSYTGYLRKPEKNITFPYHEYKEHLILGFIYTRSENLETDIVPISEIENIDSVIKDVETIIQQKHKIASDKAGSGNTTNIGSIKDIAHLRKGKGPFADLGKEVFEDYWRNFISKKTAQNEIGGKQPYRDIEEYLKWKQK